MKIKKIVIHNFRSILHQEIEIDDFSVLFGKNNSGKSNILRALRFFYDVVDDEFNASEDFPKNIKDSEKNTINRFWVEVSFKTEEKEKIFKNFTETNLKEINMSSKNLFNKDNIIVLRREGWFKKENGFMVSDRPAGYVPSDDFLFLNCGAKKIDSSFSIIEKEKDKELRLPDWGVEFFKKLIGKLIYIPENEIKKFNSYLSQKNNDDKKGSVVKKREFSLIEEMINSFIKKIIFNNTKLDSWNEQANSHSLIKKIKNNSLLMKKIINLINEKIENWNFKIEIFSNSINGKKILYDLDSDFQHFTIVNKNNENNKNNEDALFENHKIHSFGQGFQRFFLFVLEEILNMDSPSLLEKKNNSQFTLILFEEPELHLHPGQQFNLENQLKKMARKTNSQVIITTHSAFFVSNNIKKINSLISVQKEKEKTTIHQLKTKIKKPEWFNAERCLSFFYDNILIVEGKIDKLTFNFLMNHFNFSESLEKNFYILETSGKKSIRQCANLFEKLKLNWFVFYDRDKPFKNSLEKKFFKKEIEKENILKKLHSSGEIDSEEFEKLIKLLKKIELENNKKRVHGFKNSLEKFEKNNKKRVHGFENYLEKNLFKKEIEKENLLKKLHSLGKIGSKKNKKFIKSLDETEWEKIKNLFRKMK